jgi:Mrp family chromosome partitioning ATPase
MLRPQWRLAALVLAGVALASAAIVLSPQQYVARGGVMVPGGMVKAQYTAADPQAAAALVAAFIGQQKNALLIDPPLVVPAAVFSGQDLVLGGVLVAVLALFLLWRRRQPALRSENELVEALGLPVLAARPLQPGHLARQLLAHWFGRRRAVLAVVSPERRGARTRAAAELARVFAAMGEPTLLIDADLRSPGLHREFGLPNRAGLADFLEGRTTRLAHCADNLAVLVAGRAHDDPLELLSRSRLQHLLAAAAKRYRVVLVDTPAAARGPDLQLFAAFAGGALVVTEHPAQAHALRRLRDLLAGCKARIVGTVLSPARAS